MEERTVTIKNLKNIVRGDIYKPLLSLEFEESIVGWKVYFTMKVDYKDSDDSAAVKKDIITHTDPANGKTEINLEYADTKDLELIEYYYDVQVKKPSGAVRTVMKGRVKVEWEVTHRVS